MSLVKGGCFWNGYKTVVHAQYLLPASLRNWARTNKESGPQNTMMWSENLKEIDLLQNSGTDGRIMWNWFLRIKLFCGMHLCYWVVGVRRFDTATPSWNVGQWRCAITPMNKDLPHRCKSLKFHTKYLLRPCKGYLHFLFFAIQKWTWPWAPSSPCWHLCCSHFRVWHRRDMFLIVDGLNLSLLGFVSWNKFSWPAACCFL